MSRKRKTQFKYSLFTAVAVILIAMTALVGGLLATGDDAAALDATQWETVRSALDSFITTQYVADSVDGESGFTIEPATLKGLIDSNGDNVYLGEGDDAAGAPVLVDVLDGGGGGVIPTTAAIGNWNTTSLETSVVSTVAGEVDQHEAAGFSTDVVVYCLTGHTEAVAAGGYGAVSYAGGLGGTTPPKVLALKWGRYGWATGSKTYSNANPLAAPAAPTTYGNASNADASCSGSDAEVVRCTAARALSTGGGSVGNGQNPPYTLFQVIDIRTGALGTNSVGSSVITNQVPINTVFNTGLNYLNPGGAKKLIAGRTQHTAGIVAVGTEMLGYDSAFSKWGLPEYNITIGEKFPGGAGYPLVGNSIDTTAPVISGFSSGTPDSSSTTFTWSTNEPATSMVKYKVSGAPDWTVVNDTILHASHTVNLTGLAEYTTYDYEACSYDGLANGACTSGTFDTTDSAAPSVTGVAPSGTIYTDSTTVVVDYNDGTGSGIDTGSVSVTLDGSPLAGCTVSASQASCPVSGLSYGSHTIGGSVSDIAGNPTAISGGFDVGDDADPVVSFTGPTGWQTVNSFSITGTYTDAAPSSGIALANVSIDGGPPTGCTPAGGNLTCPVSGLGEGTHSVLLSVTDVAGNTGTDSGSVDVDTVDPVISNESPTGWIGTNSPTLTADYSDATSGAGTVLVELDGNNITGSCALIPGISCPTSGLGEGAHTFSVSITDNAGNNATGGSSFSVDTTAPSITNNQPTGQTGDTAPTISANYGDGSGSGIDTGSVVVTLDGSPLSGCSVGASSVSCPTSGLTDNTYSVNVSVDDNAGNNGSLGWSFTVNTAAPVIDPPFVPGDGAWTGDATPTVTMNYHASGTITDAVLTIDGTPCAGATWDQTSISCTAPTLGDGPHDVHGEVSVGANTSTADWSFSVDTTNPTVDITELGWTSDTTPTITADYNDGSGSGVSQGSVAVTLDGSPAPNCTASNTSVSCVVTTPLAEGNHSIGVNLTDNVGNPASDSTSFDIDVTAPAISNNSPTGTVANDSPTISADYSDGGSGISQGSVIVTLDGSPAPNCTASNTSVSCVVTGSLADGTHNVNVHVADNLGNANDLPWSFDVDTTGPQVTNILPAGWVTSPNQTVSADISDINGVNASTIEVKVDSLVLSGCTFASGTVTCSANGLPEGNHAINVSVDDTLGNNGTGSGSFDLDSNAPIITNTQPTGDITDSTPTISADLSDPGPPSSGIDTGSVSVSVDGNPLSGCTVSATSVSCNTSGLSGGNHDVHVGVSDVAGNTTTSDWSFNIAQRNYYMTWYDNEAPAGMLRDDILITNLGSGEADVNILIGDISDGATPDATLKVAAGEVVPWNSPGTLVGGPIRVVSTNGEPLRVSQRVIYRDSFNEVEAVADDRLESDYYFTWYDNRSGGMNGNWVHVANVGGSDAAVNVYVADMTKPATTMNIPAGQSAWWQSPTPLRDGPVRVVDTNGQPLVVSQRTLFSGSFNEVFGVRASVIADQAMFAWHDNDSLNGMIGDWILVYNMGSLDSTIDINVAATAGIAMGATSYSIPNVPAGGHAVWKAPITLVGGPVTVASKEGQPILTSQRVIYKTSFEEVQGLYPSEMGSDGGFNWYDAKSYGMKGDWILMGNNGANPATMRISMNGGNMANPASGNSDFYVGGTSYLAPSFSGVRGGPVEVNCTTCQPADRLIISQRVIYKNSFNEVVARP